MEIISIKTAKKEEFINITSEVRSALKRSGIKNGLCMVFIPHTTAGVTINENADPDVTHDIIKGLKFVPDNGFRHAEGNSPAHIKSSLIGASETIIVKNSSLQLGTWQGIYFAEFDGPRTRKIYFQLIGD